MNETTAIAALSALAQEHRLKIFRLLVREGEEGLVAGAVAERAGLSATSTSFHMKELERAGLVTATRDGRFIRYAIQVTAMRDLLAFLTAACCQGRPELCGGPATTPTCAPAAACRPASRSKRVGGRVR